MLLVGFVVQKLVANYFPPKADPAAVDKTKRLMRKRKQMMAEEAEAAPGGCKGESDQGKRLPAGPKP